MPSQQQQDASEDESENEINIEWATEPVNTSPDAPPGGIFEMRSEGTWAEIAECDPQPGRQLLFDALDRMHREAIETTVDSNMPPLERADIRLPEAAADFVRVEEVESKATDWGLSNVSASIGELGTTSNSDEGNEEVGAKATKKHSEVGVSMAVDATVPEAHVKAVRAMRRDGGGSPPSPPLSDRSFHRVNAMFIEDVVVKERMAELGTETPVEAYGDLIAEQINANPSINSSWKVVAGVAWNDPEGIRGIQWEVSPETVAEIVGSSQNDSSDQS